jgi:hypothetical protein
MRITEEDEARFWEKVEFSDNGCWLWKAATVHNGYGAFGLGGKVYRAHRVAFELAHGPIPNGLLILHKCDNRRCVRHDHLSAGTAKENTADMLAKGRETHGEQVWCAKITYEIAQAIRQERAEGQLTLSQLAVKYGTNTTSVFRIVHGTLWRRS